MKTVPRRYVNQIQLQHSKKGIRQLNSIVRNGIQEMLKCPLNCCFNLSRSKKFNSEIWPEGIAVKRYFFETRPNFETGASPKHQKI